MLLSAKTLAADNVEIINLDMTDIISRIDILYKMTNASSTPTAHPVKCVTKIEIIDGSEVLVSLSGYEAQALAYYHQRRWPMSINSWWDNQIMSVNIPIYFGRYLYDKKYALDPTKFKNLQLKITTDLNGGGSAPDAGELEVVMHIFDQMSVSPSGFFSAKEWYNYSLVSSGYETIDMPTDRTIRKILIGSLAATKQVYEQINELRLSEDADKHVPIDNRVSDYLKSHLQDIDPIIETHEAISTTSAVTHYCAATYEEDFGGVALNDADSAPIITKLRGGTMGLWSVGAGYVSLLAKGYCPHGFFEVACGVQDDPDDWLDAKSLKSLKLRLKGGSSVGSSSTAQVVVQQLVGY